MLTVTMSLLLTVRDILTNYPVPLAQLLLTTIAVAISIIALRMVNRRNIRPILIFSRETMTSSGDKAWSVHNVGYGPAIDVVIAEANQQGEWIDARRLYPLATGSKLTLRFKVAGKLGANFTDADGNPYSAGCQNNENSPRKGKHPESRQWKEAEGLWET